MTRTRTSPYFRLALGPLFNTEGEGGGGTGQPTGQTTQPPAAPGQQAENDRGYPENTPVAEMTDKQAAAYWRANARKHEDRVKAFGNLTPEELTTIRQRAGQFEALERESMSDKDKAVDEARRAEQAKATPRVVRAEFKASAKGVLSAEQLTALLEDLDLSKYVDDKGEPDEDKIERKVKAFAPAAPARQTGPSGAGLGGTTGGGKPGDAGRAMAAKRFPQKQSTS